MGLWILFDKSYTPFSLSPLLSLSLAYSLLLSLSLSLHFTFSDAEIEKPGLTNKLRESKYCQHGSRASETDGLRERIREKMREREREKMREGERVGERERESYPDLWLQSNRTWHRLNNGHAGNANEHCWKKTSNKTLLQNLVFEFWSGFYVSG